MEDNTPKNPELGPTPTPDPVVNPTVTTPGQPAESTAPVVPEAPAEPVVAAPAPVEPTHKNGSKKGLLIGLIVVVVLLIGGYFGLKAWADSAATTYFNTVNTELDEAPVGDALDSMSSSADSVEEAREEITKFRTDVVKLANVPLGATLSTKYKDAEDVEERLDTLLADLDKQLGNITGVIEFTTLLRETTSYLGSSTSATTLRSNAEKLEETVNKIRDLKLSGSAGELSTKFADAFDEYAKHIVAAADAIESRDLTAYQAAVSDIVATSSDFRSLQTEASAIQSDLKEEFEPLGEEANQLKETIEKYAE